MLLDFPEMSPMQRGKQSLPSSLRLSVFLHAAPKITLQTAQLKNSRHGLMQADEERLQRELTGVLEYFFSAWLKDGNLRTSQHRTIIYQESNIVFLNVIGFRGS